MNVFKSVTTKLLAVIIIPMLVLFLVTDIGAAVLMRQGLEKQVYDQLQLACTSLQAAYNAEDAGDYKIDGEQVFKGNWSVTDSNGLLDSMVKGSKVDLTFFYGDTRRATTVIKKGTTDRAVGTQAADNIINTVLIGGNIIKTPNANVNGTPYYAVYMPAYNRDGSVVGMYFAGETTQVVNSFINNSILMITLLAAAVFIVATVMGCVIAISISKSIRNINAALGYLADGDLGASCESERINKYDEIGNLAASTNHLAKSLNDIVSSIRVNAEELSSNSVKLDGSIKNTNQAVASISQAINDVANGAVSQAEDTTDTMASIEELSTSIDVISKDIERLSVRADESGEISSKAKETMSELIRINADTKSNIDEIVKQSSQNVDTVGEINAIIATIQEIASQTNLLSLNASIEAARAGEQGRGFAVVADEIGKLANQTQDSSGEIQAIITKLIEAIQATAEKAKKLNENAELQVDKLNQTSGMFDSVLNDVDEIARDSKRVDESIRGIGAVKTEIGQKIESLASVSENNCANAEETTANVSIIATDMAEIGDVSTNTSNLSKDLMKVISFFK